MRHKKTWMSFYNKLYASLGAQHWWPGRTKFEVMIGAILTQNTAWSNVERAIASLRSKKILTPQKLHNTPAKLIKRLIRPAGYFNQKASYLRSFTTYLKERWNFNIYRMFSLPLERLREELLSVRGLGPETVDSILLYAGEYPIFVIDAYTKRIFSRHGFCDEDVSYGNLQKKFMDNLPASREIYNEYHALIVNIGKYYCHRKTPDCKNCPLWSDK